MNFSLKIFGYIQSIIYLLMIGSLNWFHVFIKNKLITSSLINVTITCYSYFFYWPIPFEICIFPNIMYHIPTERLIFGHRFLFKKESVSNFLSNDTLHDHIWEKFFQTSPTRIPKLLPYWIFHFPGPTLVTSRSTQIFYIYLALTKGTIPVWWEEKKFFTRLCGRANFIDLIYFTDLIKFIFAIIQCKFFYWWNAIFFFFIQFNQCSFWFNLIFFIQSNLLYLFNLTYVTDSIQSFFIYSAKFFKLNVIFLFIYSLFYLLESNLFC